MLKTIGLTALLVAVAACSSVRSVTGLGDDSRVVIVPGSMANSLTQSCARTAPKPFDSAFTPNKDQIAKLERRFGECLSSPDLKSLDAYLRQYTGLGRKETKTVYLNAILQRDPEVEDATKPVEPCDGERMNFGVEYDLDADSFGSMRFNGPEFTPVTNMCP